MTPSEVYLKAAKLIASDEREMSCCAVLQAAHGKTWTIRTIDSDRYCAEYGKLMGENGSERMWSSQFYEAEDYGFGNVKDLRILALCFMAAITGPK